MPHRAAKTDETPIDLSGLMAKLSYALAAFTIEFDNAVESRLPHTTTEGPRAKSGAGPWLISQAMWSNLLCLVGDGKSVRQLRLAIDAANLHGLQRWGYLSVDAAGPSSGDHRITLRPAGLRARQVFLPLAGEIEQRWRTRHGAERIDRIKTMLAELCATQPSGRPYHLPVLGYGLALARSHGYCDTGLFAPLNRDSDLSALLAQVLLAYQIEFEQSSTRGLCLEANLFAALDGKAIAVKDLPAATGLARPLLAIAIKMLEGGGLLAVRSAGRSRTFELNATGREALARYQKRVAMISARWSKTHPGKLPDLDALLEKITGPSYALGAPLYETIDAYPQGWRAVLNTPRVLPRFPAVSHRGGYPDGA